VKIVLVNKGGIHDLVIDGFNVRTPQIGDGKSAEVTFVVDKTGTFEYYCSVGNHRQMGMVGKLIVL
jgi:nitrite reductase (NO-forming)